MTEPRPKSCDRARLWVSLALDDELSDFEDRLLDAHLERCPECREYESGVRAAAAALVAVGVTGFFTVSGQNQRPNFLERVGHSQDAEAADLRALRRSEIASQRQSLRPEHVQAVRPDKV